MGDGGTRGRVGCDGKSSRGHLCKFKLRIRPSAGHHRPLNKFMEPSTVCTYDSHSGVEYVGFPSSPAAIGTISRKFASNVASILASDR